MINKAPWYLAEDHFTEIVLDIIHYKVFENYIFTATSPRGQWVNPIDYDQFSYFLWDLNFCGIFWLSHSSNGIFHSATWGISHKEFSSPSSKSHKTYFVLRWKIIMISGYNFAHATTAQLSWHVQNCDLIKSLETKLKQNTFYEIWFMSS